MRCPQGEAQQVVPLPQARMLDAKQEYEFIGTMKGRNVVSASQQTELNKIYNRVFHDNVQPTNCGSCMRGRLEELSTLYNAY
jgi:hypothetical protein